MSFFCRSLVDIKLNMISPLRNLTQRKPAKLYRSFCRSTSTFGISLEREGVFQLCDSVKRSSTSAKRNVFSSHSHCSIMHSRSCISRSSFFFSGSKNRKIEKLLLRRLSRVRIFDEQFVHLH